MICVCYCSTDTRAFPSPRGALACGRKNVSLHHRWRWVTFRRGGIYIPATMNSCRAAHKQKLCSKHVFRLSLLISNMIHVHLTHPKHDHLSCNGRETSNRLRMNTGGATLSQANIQTNWPVHYYSPIPYQEVLPETYQLPHIRVGFGNVSRTVRSRPTWSGPAGIGWLKSTDTVLWSRSNTYRQTRHTIHSCQSNSTSTIFRKTL